MKERHKRKWTAEEVEYLRAMYHKRNIREVSDELGRTPVAVYCKMKELNLIKHINKRVKIESQKHTEGTVRYYKSEGKRYWKIKIDGKWVSYAKYLYEQAHGPLPEGFVVSYKDRDTNNVRLDNLIAAPLSKLKRRKRKPKSLLNKILDHEI